MKAKPRIPSGNGDELTQFELNRRLTAAKIDESRDRAQNIRTNEKTKSLQLAVTRGELILKKLAVDQLTYLHVAMRAKMLGAGLAYHRKLLACKTPHEM